jgi:citrate/tricarballylate utilization protein
LRRALPVGLPMPPDPGELRCAPAPAALAAIIAEARRTLALCNVCGYCTGYCDVFHAAERRPQLAAGDLVQFAHLCHNCRSCYYACQYAPPHELSINVPATLARLRSADYRQRAWPGAVSTSSLTVLVIACIIGVPLAMLLALPGELLFTAQRGPGAFYALIPWRLMSAIAALAFGGAALLIIAAVIVFWRQTSAGAVEGALALALPRALADVATLRNLDGGGSGCHEREDVPARARRHSHHALFYGFLLCLASTASAAFSQHVLGVPAPYPLLSIPVVTGSVGGIAMLVGIVGLARSKAGADPAPSASETFAADRLLLATLAGVAASGLVLLALRETPAMGLLLALHLGCVLGLALSMPYGKFVHGFLRAAALLRQAMQRPGRGHGRRDQG